MSFLQTSMSDETRDLLVRAWASESGDTAWSYDSVLNIYRRIGDWQGAPDHLRRRTGGLVFVQSAPDPNPIAPAMVEGARSLGMPAFDSNNGRLREGAGGASIIDLRVRDGKRLSIFRHFAAAFRRLVGLSPRAYRQSISR
jgi:choline dehydrogenase